MKLHLPVKLFRAVLACMAAVSFVSFTSTTSTCYAATEEEEEENDLLMLLSEPEYPNGSITYTTRQTSAPTLTGYESILFEDISSTSNGGAVYSNGTVSLNGNGAVTFSGNAASTSSDAAVRGGAIYCEYYARATFTLSGNGAVTFSENSVTGGDDSGGGAIYNYTTFTLSNNRAVTFSENSVTGGDISRGGAIYSYRSTFTLSGNGDVTFSGNSVSSGDFSDAYGGAIYNSGTFTLSDNGAVTFSGNTADVGGAISTDLDGTFTLSGNGDVTFSGNRVSSRRYAAGGAIYSESTFTLSGNGDVTFSGNTNTAYDDDGWAYGGAICNNRTFTLSDNGAVTFSGNTACGQNRCDGGAIYNDYGTFTLSGNGDVTFSGNTACTYDGVAWPCGGAIYNFGTFTLSGNGDVLFEKNAEVRNGTYRLRSIYSYGDLNLSASEGKRILFRDSVHAFNPANLNLNGAGDIIFTGATTEADLLEVKGSAGTTTEILRSQISQFHADVELVGGTLQVQDGAKLTLGGLSVGSVSQSASLQMQNGWVDISKPLSLSSGFSLSLFGCNYLLSSGITAEGHNTLNIQLETLPQQAAALTVVGELQNANNLIINLGNISGLAGNNYHILHIIGESAGWHDAVLQLSGASASALTWVGNDLYYRYNAAQLSPQPRTDKTITQRLSVDGFEMLSMNKALIFNGASSGITNSEDYAVILDNNAVTFSGNSISSANYSSYSCGGAIFNTYGTFTLSGNGDVTFSGNRVRSQHYAKGGAIFNTYSTFTLSGNGDVTFSGNRGISDLYALGGAIDNDGSYGSTFTLSGNGDVTFSGNSVSGSSDAYGGAISNSDTFTLSGNGAVTFSGNSASTSSSSASLGYSAYGGAIYNYSGTFTLSGNESVTFSGNTASATSSDAYGGAISNRGTFTLSGNGDVLFEKNAEVKNETYRLRSIYSLNSYNSGATLNLASLEGKSIIFRDSLYAEGTVNLNQDYTDSEGVVHKSTGDIIFTGATTEADLREVKGGIDGTAEEILNSRTSEIATMTNLYGGRLIVEDMAILRGNGITAAADSGATVRVKDGTLDHSGYALTFNTGTTLEAEGVNAVTAASVDMLAGSTLSFVLGEANLTTAALTLTGRLTTETISIAISGLDESEPGHDTYALLSATTYDTSAWTADKITVVTEGVSFENLVWKDGTLYLNYIPDLTTATWTNASGDGLWNASSLNWTQDGHSYAYADGVDVIFGNEGAGTVSLVGDLAPKSVLINNGSGFDYTFAGTGKLTGTTALTKQGAGKLTINTANDYTGGSAINGGTLVAGNAAALGTGAVAVNGGTLEIAATGFANDTSFAGTSALVVDAGYQLALSKMLANSGVLTVSGTLNASSLTLNTTAATHVDVNGNSGASGFAKGALYSVQVVNGGTVAGTAASITHLNLPTGETLALGSDGIATAGGAIDYSEYLLTGSDTVSSSAIHGVEGAANATVTQNGGTLTVDDTVTVNGTGGAITLNGGTLNGSLQGMTIDAVAGTLAATLTGNNTLIGHDFALNAPLDNQGTLVLNGTFDLSGMTPTTTAPTHIDVNGNSGASGFAKTELQEVTIATGGTINASEATFTHNGNTLTLGEDGVASVGGTIDYSNYLLTGSDTASSSAIHGVEGAANATVTQNGGTLTVDDTVTVTTTAGTIALNGGTLNGTVSGATINATSGALNATLSGNNTLNGNNYALGSVIDNSGTLTFSGTFDASALTLDTTAATHIDVNGNSGANGFAKDAFYAVTLATGTTVNAGATITHGSHTLTLGADGIATAGGAVDYGTYFLHSGAEVAVRAIRSVPEAADAMVDMDGGLLAADADVFVKATGGRIEVSHGANVAGSIRDTQIAIHGCEISADITGNSSVYVDGDTILSGHNTYTGNTDVVDGGMLKVTGSVTADIYLHGGMLDTATGMTLVSGQDIFFRGGQVKGNLHTVSGSGMHLAQSSTVNGSVTLGGGTLTLSNGATLHVTGSLTLAAPTQLVGDWQQNQTYTLISTNGGVNADGVADLNSFFGVEESVGTVKVEGKDVVLSTIMEAVEETVTPDAVDKGMVNASWAALATVRDFARVAGSQRHKLLEGNAFVWGSGFGSFMKVNSTDGFSNSTTGYAAGVQYGLTGETRIGAAIGQSDGQFKTKFHREGTQIDQKGLFGAVTLQHEEQVCATGDVLVDVFAAYGHVKNEAKLNRQHTAGRADWTDHVLNIGGRLSYAQTVDTNVWVIPFVGLEWLYGKQGSTNTTDGRRYEGDAASVLRLPVGITLRASYETEGGSYVVPEVTFGYEGDLVQHNPKAQVRNGGKEYTTEGYAPARSQWMMNVGLNVYFDAHWSAGAGYTLESRPHALNQNANVSVRYAF